MKRKLLSFVMAALLGVLPLSAAQAEEQAAEVDIFDYINIYDTELTQPGLSAEEKAALTSESDAALVTENARYQVERYAYDGCTLYMMVRVTALDPAKHLLMSDYGYMEEDPIPRKDAGPDDEPGESFAEAAQRTGRSILTCGFYIDGLGDTQANSAAYNESFEEDGSMILFGHFNYAQPLGAREEKLCMTEYTTGEEKKREYELPMHLEPTAELAIAEAKCDVQLDMFKLESVQVMRSPLGLFAYVNGTMTSVPEDKQALMENMGKLFVKLSVPGEGDIFLSDGGSALIYGPQGQPKWIEEAQPGDSTRYEITGSACAAMPEKLDVTIYDYTGESEDVTFTVELERVN